MSESRNDGIMDGNDVTNLLLPPLCLPVDTGGKLGRKVLWIVIQS